MDRHNMRRPLQTALAAWSQARDAGERGDGRRTGLAYQRAVNHLQVYVSGLRDGRGPREEVCGEVAAACHALSILGREAVPRVLAAGARHYAAIHARVTLAAAHLADPAHGDRSQVAAALGGPVLDRFDPDGAGDVAPAERIAGAADVRMMMAGLIADHPPARGAKGEPWQVTHEADEGFLALHRDRRRFRRAVLPSCAGLGPEAEAVQLAKEGVRLHAELARRLPSHKGEHERVARELTALARRLGITPPDAGE